MRDVGEGPGKELVSFLGGVVVAIGIRRFFSVCSSILGSAALTLREKAGALVDNAGAVFGGDGSVFRTNFVNVVCGGDTSFRFDSRLQVFNNVIQKPRQIVTEEKSRRIGTLAQP